MQQVSDFERTLKKLATSAVDNSPPVTKKNLAGALIVKAHEIKHWKMQIE
jgi:hypothetical protein